VADLREQQRITAELQKQKEILEAHNKESQAYKKATQEINRLNVERVKVESQIADAKARAASEADTLSLEKQILNIKKSVLGAANKELGLDKQIKVLREGASKADKETVKQTRAYADLLEGVASGSMDLEAVLSKIATEDFGIMNKMANDLADTLRDTPNLTEKLKIEAQAQQKINDFRDRISEASALLSSPKAMGVAALGLAAKIATDFASSMLDIRQSLGTSAIDSARLAGNMAAAGAAAKVVGGNSQEAEAAVKGLVREFGSLSVVTLEVSTQLGLITGQFGISGDNAAKLLKSMDAISTASIETNLNLISTVGELARAEGVAPAQVLNDMASDTELFAKFGKDGGKNIGLAAIQAAKLGVNMATVAGIAESLLDFESSITNEMEAEVLLGKNLNLDKARQLSLAGDFDGLQKEILKNVGSEAEFNAMNVVQRQALAKSLGMNVADLANMVAGEKTSAEIQKDQAKTQKKQMDMQHAMMITMAGMQGIQTVLLALEMGKNTALVKGLATRVAGIGASLAGAVGPIFTGASILGPLGIPVALAAIASMFALGKTAMGFEDGGMAGVDGGTPGSSDTIPAMLTPGEVVLNAAQQSNVAGAIGGGGGAMIDNTALIKTTNQLLTKVNEGINTLIRKTGEQALTS
jgi:hypothetical protein